MLHILQTVNELTDHGVTLVPVTDGIDSSAPAGRMMTGVLESLAEYERELTIECTALKRAASRAIGTKFGRLGKSTTPRTSHAVDAGVLLAGPAAVAPTHHRSRLVAGAADVFVDVGGRHQLWVVRPLVEEVPQPVSVRHRNE
jgi:hypothetical protein